MGRDLALSWVRSRRRGWGPPPCEDGGKGAFLRRIQVQHDQERQAAVRGHDVEKLDERLDAACRRTQTDDGNGAAVCPTDGLHVRAKLGFASEFGWFSSFGIPVNASIGADRPCVVRLTTCAHRVWLPQAEDFLTNGSTPVLPLRLRLPWRDSPPRHRRLAYLGGAVLRARLEELHHPLPRHGIRRRVRHARADRLGQQPARAAAAGVHRRRDRRRAGLPIRWCS